MRCSQLSWVAPLLALGALGAQEPASRGVAVGRDSVRLYYETVGHGADTVVFLHGTPSTMYSLARDLSVLGNALTLIFFDQRGGGRSQLVLAPDSLTWQNHIEDIEAIRRHLGVSRWNLFGISWGSLLAARYALAYPERVKRIVVFPRTARTGAEVPTNEQGTLIRSIDSVSQRLVDSLLRAWPGATNPRAVCDEYWRTLWPTLFVDTTKARTMRGSMCDEPPEVLRHTWQVSAAKSRSLGQFDLRPELRRISAPTLVIKGTRTTMYHAWTEEWARALPNARLLWIEDAGLFPWLEKPDRVLAALRTFYQGTWPDGAIQIR